MSLAEVIEAERTGRVPVRVLAELSTALGGTLDDLLSGRAFWEAPGIALKAVDDVERGQLIVGLARVAAAMRDHRALAETLRKPDLWAQRGNLLGPRAVEGELVVQAEKLAKEVRLKLDNPIAPLASVRDVLAQLGVVTFFTQFPDEEVDGAMLRFKDASPCVVVAASSSRVGLTTAIRMTLAHELCHALYDRPKAGATGRVDRRSGSGGSKLDRRASAFAAHLLAPREGVQRFLSDGGVQGKPSEQVLLGLSRHFGLGVQAMAFHLVHLRLWEEDDVRRHEGLRSAPFRSTDDRELESTAAEGRIPLERRGVLLDLATEALAAGQISLGRWQELLRITSEGDTKALLEERHVSVSREHYLG